MSRYSILRKRRRLFQHNFPTSTGGNPSRTRRSRIVSSLFSTTLPEHFRIERRTPSDPLAEIPILPHHPPEFSPGARYTAERKEAMNVNPDGFLLPDEEKLVHHIIREHEPGFAWEESEKGQFSSAYFDDVVIPTIEHLPWTLRNIPIRLASMIALWKLSSRK